MPADNPIAANPTDSSGYRRGGSSRPPPREGSSRLGLNLVLAVLVAGLVVAGWFVTMQYRQLQVAEATLDVADKRIARLEARLQVTDQTMSSSGDEVQDQMGFWETEIRKVWDVANKRNKNWIVENQGALKRHDAKLASIDGSIKNINSAVSRYDAAFGQQNAIVDQLAALELQIRQVGEQQRRNTDQINVARQSLASLESGIERRVANNEEAVEAIDAYRIQLNNRLTDVKSRIDTLHGAPLP